MTKEFKSWQSYLHFADTIKKRTRYIYDKEVNEFLEMLHETSAERITSLPKSSLFWRAQLGNDIRVEHINDGDFHDTYEVEAPSEPERMKPLCERAKEGRANPKGISYLYLASERETALAEVRPWKGAYISVAQFRTRGDIKVMNCTDDQKYNYHCEEPSSDKKSEAVWRDIDRAFARPVTLCDDVADYAPTQIITEFFKSKGFDGIAYRSSLDNSATLEKGFNIVLFDIAAVEQSNCFLYKLSSINYEFSEVANPYFIKKKPC